MIDKRCITNELLFKIWQDQEEGAYKDELMSLMKVVSFYDYGDIDLKVPELKDGK